MTSGGKKMANVIDIGSDDAVKDTITRAKGGNQSAAWYLIHQIESALTDHRVSGPLFDHAAKFFGALLDIHDAEDGHAKPSELAKAFETLHIIRRRGQPKRDDDEEMLLAARVVLLTEADFSVDKAVGALEGLNDYTRSAYRTAYEAWGEQFARLSTTKELEVMAGVSQDDLLQRLKALGAITQMEHQDAVTAVSAKHPKARGTPTS